MKKAIVIAVLLIGGAGAYTWHVKKVHAAKVYIPNPLQTMTLQFDQQKAINAKIIKDQADSAFGTALATLQNDASKVEIENKWPLSLNFNPDTLQYSEPQATPVLKK